MPHEVGGCIATEWRGAVVYYFFRVSNGETSHDVPVGITDHAIHPVGKPARTGEILMPAAKAWLEHNLEHNFDPASQWPLPLLDLMLLDYWLARREFPAMAHFW